MWIKLIALGFCASFCLAVTIRNIVVIVMSDDAEFADIVFTALGFLVAIIPMLALFSRILQDGH